LLLLVHRCDTLSSAILEALLLAMIESFDLARHRESLYKYLVNQETSQPLKSDCYQQNIVYRNKSGGDNATKEVCELIKAITPSTFFT